MEYRQVKDFTQCNESRISSLAALTGQLLSYGIKGDFCEFGVWKGGACMAMAATMVELRQYRPIHMFDTFADGHDPQDFTEFDVEIPQGAISKGRRASDVAANPAYKGVGWQESLDNVLSTGISGSLVTVHVGNAQDTVKKYKPAEGIALLRLDMDWYKPTKAVLERIFPAINKGGVLIVDDYGQWAGCKKAVDEYLVGPYERFPRMMVDFSCLVVWVV